MNKLPPQVQAGQWRVMSPSGTGLFVSPLELVCAQWNLSFRAPESLCAQLNEQFKDPTARQVTLLICSLISLQKPQCLDCHLAYMNVTSSHMLHLSKACLRHFCSAHC